MIKTKRDNNDYKKKLENVSRKKKIFFSLFSCESGSSENFKKKREYSGEGVKHNNKNTLTVAYSKFHQTLHDIECKCKMLEPAQETANQANQTP